MVTRTEIGRCPYVLFFNFIALSKDLWSCFCLLMVSHCLLYFQFCRFVIDTCRRLREKKSYMVYTAVGCLGVSALSDLVREV